MTTAVIQTAFTGGEVSPDLYGRVDMAKFHLGASTCRNCFISYRGGAFSRAGSLFVGQSKQPGVAPRPRLINFQFSNDQGYALEWGEKYVRFIQNGAYIAEGQKAITAITRASPGVVTIPTHGYSNGDWIFLFNIVGMTQLNNGVYIVDNATTNTLTLKFLTGNPVDTSAFSAYISGGFAARIYTLTTPYAAADLPALKFTQSADVMTLTHTSYPTQNLKRFGATNWTITPITFASVIAAPATISASASKTTSSDPTQYQFEVTAVDQATGQESVASPIATVTNSVDIASVAGSITINWASVPNAGSYNIYKAPEAFAATVPAGAIFGFLGTALGLGFVDTNITADYTKAPPQHLNPFAPGQIQFVLMSGFGTGYSGVPTLTIGTASGTGFVGLPIVIGGQVQAIVVMDAGQNYQPGDTITISGGGGSGASATLQIGPETGTYPGCVCYFQQRRVYANTTNNPDTYYMSQPGAFENMDASIPSSASDAITGTPWSQQVNGIQAMINMPGGLVILTGLGAWQLTGGAQSQAVTPADQFATPQAYNGCHNLIPPITINYDILYVQSKGSIIRDLSYNFFVNIYTGTDVTVLSAHLFTGYNLIEWAWAEEPYKLVWVVRDDGTLLMLTYLKEQDVYAWSRSDTNGLYQSICSVSEPPVNAIYVAVKRYIQGTPFYYIERMDNRLWNSVEDVWAVDCGARYPMPTPQATLTPASATGSANIGSYNLIAGGLGYVAPVGIITDPTGQSASVSLTVTLGVITGAVPNTLGSGYTNPTLTIVDTGGPGAGAVVQPIITNNVIFNTDAAVFSPANIGDVIRCGGGIATVVGYSSTSQVTANITQPITATLPNDPTNQPIPQAAGKWTITTPTSFISGLGHLEGKLVSILADGSVAPQQVVTGGAVALPAPASAITAGLPFQAQVQSLYLDVAGGPTIQGKRKTIQSVTVRLYKSRGIKVGANKVDSSTTPSNAIVPWPNMKEIKDRPNSLAAGVAVPLYTGDQRINIPSDWNSKGQVAVQQDYPLPMNILAFIPEVVLGDDNG